MRTISLRFGAFALVLLSWMTATAQQSWTSSSQKAIADVEMRWLEHIDDPAALEQILADDFVHVLPSGFITKRQHIDYVKSHPRSPTENRSFESLTVRVYGDTGVSNGIVVTTGSGGTRRTVFTDIFVKRNGHWQAVNAQENPQQTQH